MAARVAESQPRSAPGAIPQLDATLERLGKRQDWGHLTEDLYRSEWDRLTTLRAELVAAESVEPDAKALPLGSLMEGWATGDAHTRRDLLAEFFDQITFRDGEVEVTPRKDRAALVATLLERAWGSAGVALAGRYSNRLAKLEGIRTWHR